MRRARHRHHLEGRLRRIDGGDGARTGSWRASGVTLARTTRFTTVLAPVRPARGRDLVPRFEPVVNRVAGDADDGEPRSVVAAEPHAAAERRFARPEGRAADSLSTITGLRCRPDPA
jgi:hypothetical protein